MRSLWKAVVATMPSSVTPTPKCAKAVPHAERREHAAPALDPGGGERRQERQTGRGHEALGGAHEIAPLPGEQRPERGGEQQRHYQRPEGHVEEGRADRDLVTRERFERQRIERADEDRRAGGRQKQIVEDERALAAHGREQPALLQPRRTPGEQREPAVDAERQNGEDEDAA